jgi:type IX secretion system PorP/SprF family membrane protein
MKPLVRLGLLATSLLTLPLLVQGQSGIGPLPFANPALLSPALAGLIEGNIGFDFSHRVRRVTDNDNFQTSVLSVDYPYFSPKLNGGLGLLFYNDGAGGLIRREGGLQAAWEAPLGRKVRYHHLRAGIGLGIIQLSVDQPRLIFANQFNTFLGILDPSKPGELLPGQSSQPAFDASLGLVYYRTQKIKGNPELNYYFGGSIYNLTEPNVSLLESDDMRLSRRYVAFGGAKYRTRSSLDLNTNFAFQSQNNSQIMQLGAFARTAFFEEGKLFGNEAASLFFGINARLQLGKVELDNEVVINRKGLETITPFLGFEFAKSYSLAVSSDIVAADKTLTSSSFGGVQFMFSYVIGGKKYSKPSLPFPIF